MKSKHRLTFTNVFVEAVLWFAMEAVFILQKADWLATHILAVSAKFTNSGVLSSVLRTHIGGCIETYKMQRTDLR